MYSGYHRIIDVRWTPQINMLKMRCGGCDAIFEHRADRWTVRCPSCGKQGGLAKIRQDWVNQSLHLDRQGRVAEEADK